MPRREDERVLRGQAQYLDDVHLDGMLHVAFVRSPFPRARIGGIAKPDGVFVLTAADLGPEVRGLPTQTLPGIELADAAHPVLARDEARYVGQAVAAVVAVSRAEAEDAAELVEVDWEPLDAVVDPRAAPEWLYRYSGSGGDVEGGFARAEHTIRQSFSIPRIVTSPIETHGAIAAPRPDGGLTVWASAQGRDRTRDQLRHALGRDDVEVVVPDVGGAFGSKGAIAPEYAATALCAAALGRPVKWTEDRLENFLAAYQGRGLEADVELAVDGEGRFLAIRARLYADAGAYLYPTTPTPGQTTANLLCGCYAIPACAVEVYGARTTKVPVGPSRGAGRPEAALLVEGMVEEAGRQLGRDPVELRRRNFVREFPHRTPLGYVYDSGDFERCLDRALELVRPERSRDGERLVGTGIGCYVERAGGMWETASVAREDGRVVVTAGSSPHGQGHATTFAQIAADELGVPAEQVEVRFEGGGIGTFASRSVAMAGSAVALACRKLLAEGGDSATVRFESDMVFSSGCYAAVVEVERATGRLTILRIAAVDDCGRVVNPLLAEGQVYGGTAYGLGECLVEEARTDEWGNPLATSFASYHLLTAAEIPPVEPAFVETPSPLNPLGAKGIGEGGSIGVLPAIANAVGDACGRKIDPPFGAEKLWEAIR
ncbi:MAG TPA: xanthine dehydrogenase family protein molybdopterin-binding subunit [Gaiellaceae bacterium]|nr:xanthine dehydrogenase family protein molybdopterin-binding subunit [Gaiellaceae bacterium]